MVDFPAKLLENCGRTWAPVYKVPFCWLGEEGEAVPPGVRDPREGLAANLSRIAPGGSLRTACVAIAAGEARPLLPAQRRVTSFHEKIEPIASLSFRFMLQPKALHFFRMGKQFSG